MTNWDKFAVPVLIFVASAAFWYVVRYARAIRWSQRTDAEYFSAREDVISSIRLRLPQGADLVVLEHKLRFKDARNRNLVEQKLIENSFDVSMAETYEGETAFWLLAKRPVLVDRAPDEIRLVASFTAQSGGTYAEWNPAG